MPVTNVKTIARSEQLSGAPFPAHLAAQFDAVADDPKAVRALGIEQAAALGQRLLDEGTDADLGDERWNAVVAASVSLTATPLGFGVDDVDRLRDAGLDDASIVDVIGGAAFFNWANRLMLSLGEPEVPAAR